MKEYTQLLIEEDNSLLEALTRLEQTKEKYCLLFQMESWWQH